MKTRAQLLLTGLSVLPALTMASAKNEKPHIILIMTDQHRFDALGCIEGSPVISPNIDALAKDGNLFCNAYSSSPSSTPARAGLLTGMSPWKHGMLGYGKVAEKYPYELPQMLRDLGYMTMGIGKMHYHPQTALHGFHTTILDESGRREAPYFISDYHKWFYTNAFGENPDKTGIGWNDHGNKSYQLDERLHPTKWTGDVAVSAIENYQSDQPLFLKISFARPHSPYDAPQRLLDRYSNTIIPAPAKGDWSKSIGANLTDPAKNPEAAFGNFGDAYAKKSRRNYYASITFIDEQVGRIIEELKAKGMYENALICFVSDHGDMMGDHNHWRKTYAYEGSAAIPFIVKMPKSVEMQIEKGEILDYPVELRDLLPTFLDVNNFAKPEAMDGLSLLPLLTSKSPQWRKWLDLEHATCYKNENYWCALTDGKLKYIWFMYTGEEQLFDLDKDPYESENLIGNTKYTKITKEMREAMKSHLEERGEEWVKDNELVKRNTTLLYSPNYPENK